MPKFFVEPEKVQDGKIIIDTEDVNHIMRVLRMKKGDSLTVCDSCGMDYTAVISDTSDKSVICDIVSSCKSDTEPGVYVKLYQGIPKGSKMEYIIQKTVELGVSEIVPVKMSRCVVRFDNAKDEKKKTERWQKIAESAAKQSGRGIIPKVSLPVTFPEAVADMKKSEISFAPYECEAENSIRCIIEQNSSVKSVGFIIGPEGGFDLAEVQKLLDENIKTVTLGKRILRTETAGEAVIAMLMYGLGEI